MVRLLYTRLRGIFPFTTYRPSSIPYPKAVLVRVAKPLRESLPRAITLRVAENNDVVSMGGMSEFVSRKLGQRVGSRRNRDMRMSWLADLSRLTAEQLAFIDDKLFKESTGRGDYAYAFVGVTARCQISRT